jgi:tetratricopeptide (TPR) repeat protein
MAAKKPTNEPDNLKTVESVLSQSEAFIEKYQKQILYGVGVVILIVLVVLAFRNWYLIPKENNAETKLAACQNYFAVDSFQVALNGDGTDNCIGLKRVINEYGLTKSANLANAYAGVCSYKLHDYNAAIKYLKKFSGNDVNISYSVTGLIGDCYVELGQTQEAIKYFLKAADSQNDMVSPIYLKKAGIAYESLGDYKQAIDMYTKIKDQYFKSQEAADIDRYIGRAQALVK